MNKTEKEDTEQKILTAAKAVFMKKGMDGARMQEIANEANINKALLHYYFRSKDQLFQAVFKSVFEDFFPKLPSIMSSTLSLEEKINWMVEGYTAMINKNPYLPQFILTEVNRNPERIQNLFQESGIDPAKMIGFLSEFKNNNYDARHFLINFLGMIVFPYMAMPIVKKLLFAGNGADLEKFMGERPMVITDILMKSISTTE